MIFCLLNINFWNIVKNTNFWKLVLVTSRHRINCTTLQDIFVITFQIKIAIEPGAFHYTFWCHDQLLNFGKDISQDNFGRNFRNSQDKQNSHQGKDNSTQTKLVWVVVSDI